MMMEGDELNINNNNNNNNGKVFRKCGRWNPTSEQVKVLTDLFRSGLRTPSTDQIQTISSQLSFYGKIESKNVFYWFQNHKARERHKRRKTSSNTSPDIITNPKILEPSERVILETLQLFPLKSNNGCSKETVVSDHHQSLTQKDHVTPLDLRLSSYIL